MLRLGICDDDSKFLDLLKIYLNEYLTNREFEYKINFYSNPKDMIEENFVFDILILDIEMPYLNGIQLAKKVKEKNKNVTLIFITHHDDYLDAAFDLKAFRYLKKPVEKERLYKSLDMALERVKKVKKKVIVKYKNSENIIDAEKIIYVETANRGLKLITTDGEMRVVDTIKNFKNKVYSDTFIQIHGSYIVNLNYVSDYNENTVFLKHNNRIYETYVSRRKFIDFKNRFINFVKEDKYRA